MPAPPAVPVGRALGCNCSRRHRTYAAVARCRFPNLAYNVRGEGRYAFIENWERKGYGEIELFATLAGAQACRRYEHDVTGQCCGSCRRKVRVVILAPLFGESDLPRAAMYHLIPAPCFGPEHPGPAYGCYISQGKATQGRKVQA